MQRRRFLASAAALSTALVAGCTGTSSDTTTSTTADTTTQRTSTTTTTTPVVGDVWVGRSFRYLYAGAHVNAYTVTGDGPMFAFALVSDGEHPALVLDGESHDPADELPGGTGADAVFFDQDTDERRVVSYSLSAPVDSASGSVADHELTDDQLAFLADPPVFEVTDVAVPESVQAGNDVTVSVTAANFGGSPGAFRAAATSESLSAFTLGSTKIAAGERETVALTVPINSENEERVNYTWGSSGGDRTVGVQD